MKKLVIGFRINKYLLADSDSVFMLNEIVQENKRVKITVANDDFRLTYLRIFISKKIIYNKSSKL